MKIQKMKKTVIVLGIIFLAVGLISSNAFSWGSATHAYIDDQLNKQSGTKNLNEIYGGMSPDMFIYMFDSPYLQYLNTMTHYDFMKVWDKSMNTWLPSKSSLQKSLAYGFVSHNDLWGADSTAHHAGITFGTEGYIIAKAELLKPIILEQLIVLFPGPLDPEFLALLDAIALEVSHELVEYGVDILIKRINPAIGQEVSASAMARSREFSLLLVKSYAKDFSEDAGIHYFTAVRIITNAEREFRNSMILYGQVLLQDETTAIQLISEQMAELSTAFLIAYGIELPEDTDLTPLIQFTIEQSIDICGNDFKDEITATINFVDQQLKLNGISY